MNFMRNCGIYKIRNSVGEGGAFAVFWSVFSLRREFGAFKDVGVSGLNLVAGYIGKRKSDDYVKFMKMERRLPVFVQQLSHALVVVASK